MADCIILRGGNDFDNSKVSAVPAVVRTGKRFLGRGSDAEQLGELRDVAAATYDLPLNGTNDIPPGIHAGNVVVRQAGVVTMDGGTIYPRDYDQTVNTANKYMKSDVYISALTGLVPENIKKGVVIQVGDKTITGTYEGYN